VLAERFREIGSYEIDLFEKASSEIELGCINSTKPFNAYTRKYFFRDLHPSGVSAAVRARRSLTK
jgi:hypothetical protein